MLIENLTLIYLWKLLIYDLNPKTEGGLQNSNKYCKIQYSVTLI